MLIKVSVSYFIRVLNELQSILDFVIHECLSLPILKRGLIWRHILVGDVSERELLRCLSCGTLLCLSLVVCILALCLHSKELGILLIIVGELPGLQVFSRFSLDLSLWLDFLDFLRIFWNFQFARIFNDGSFLLLELRGGLGRGLSSSNWASGLALWWDVHTGQVWLCNILWSTRDRCSCSSAYTCALASGRALLRN